MNYIKTTSVSTAVLLATVGAGPASAQAPLQLEEVVVTAQKRSENVQDIPLSVSSLSTGKMDELSGGGADIRFLNGRVPSLQVESSFGRSSPRFYLRGLGNTDFDLNASQPVSIIFDEVVQENNLLKGFPVFDVERIEVLRGPQGTLFGRNSPAGIVKFDSKKPTQELDGYFKSGFGSFGLVSLEGAVGGPLSDTLSARLAIQHESRDDIVDNAGPAEDLEEFEETAARVQLLWDVTDNLSTLFNVHFRDLEGTARTFRANIIEPGTNDFVAGYDFEDISTNGPNDQTVETAGGSVRFDYDIGSTTLTGIYGYETVEMSSVGDIDGGIASFLPNGGPGFIPFDSNTQGDIPDHSQHTFELRLASNGAEKLNWQAGVFVFDEDLLVRQTSVGNDGELMPDPFGSRQVFQDQQTSAWGVFGRVDFNLSDNFEVAAGLRYSDDEKDYRVTRFEPISGALENDIAANPSDDFISWDLSGTYFISDDVSVYARAGTSSRAPSVQGRIIFGAPEVQQISEAGTETNTSFEVGIKSELLARRLRLNATVYTWEMEDQQITSVGGENNRAILLSADKTEGAGIEADIAFVATERLTLSGGFSYNDTEIDDSTLGVAPCASSCTILDPIDPETGLVLIDGNSLPQSSEWIANFELQYAVPIGENNELTFSTDWVYQDDARFTLYESEEFGHDGFVEGGVRVAYLHNDGQYEIALYGRNITDEEYLNGAIDFNNLTGMVNEPRVWGIEFVVNFGY